MKVLLINGSPRQHGCTDAALSLVAESLHEAGIETEVFWLGNRPIGGCLACRKCAETGRCVQQDKVNEFLEIAGEYDGFVVGSPVHFASAAGSLTTFLDRVFYAGRNQRESFAFKPGAAVVSARRAGTTATLDQLNKYFLYMEMPLIGSRYWNMVHGMTPEEVLQDTEGVQIMRTLGRNMAWFLKCKEAAEAAGISAPEQEPWTPTNFIRRQGDHVMLPKDPVILLSFVNTKLRDEFESLEELCAALDADAQTICDTLAALDYRYDPAGNRFV